MVLILNGRIKLFLIREVFLNFIDKNHTGGSSLIKTSCNEISEVSVCSLDEFITEDLGVDAIKIDVEK